MKGILILTAVLSIGAVELSISDTPSRQELSTEKVRELIGKLDYICSGNDNGGITKYDVSKFNSKKAKRQLRKENDGCPDMKMSKSREEAVAAFEKAFKGGNHYWKECIDEELSKEEQNQILQVVRDPGNLGVFSSEYVGNGNESGACSFSHYFVFRKDGDRLYIVRDDTD